MKALRLAAAVLVLGIFVVASQSVLAADKSYFQTDGVAIRGYDPVAYFDAGTPTEGSPEHAVEWMGATWHFASAANRAKFQSNPDQYAPQYGGYCAWAVSSGYTASIDPTAWKVVDGKLYLNYSTGVQSRWSQDIPGNIQKADNNWPDIKTKLN